MAIENQNSQKAESKIEVIFDYSIEDECARVMSALKKHTWYIENKYKPKYPELIQQKLEKEEKISEKDVRDAVPAEFDSVLYAEQVMKIKEGWGSIQDRFFENLKTLRMPLQDKYFVCATKYGTGGSYGVPNDIQLNLGRAERAAHTLAHEIVHLTIEHLIKEYGIAHWAKERLVDLIMNKFFPENQKLQRDPENSEKITEIFNAHFPDITKVIKAVSEIK